MTSQETLPAVELELKDDLDPNDPFEIEKRSFWAMREQLLDQFEGQYVAIYQGHVIDHDPDKIRLGLRTYRQHGYKPIYFQLVTRQLLPVVHFSSPHITR